MKEELKMALITEEQRQGELAKKNEDRAYIKPLYAISPASNAAKNKTYRENVFVFDKKEYETIDVVAIDRRACFKYGPRDKKVEVRTTSGAFYTETPEFQSLLAKHVEKDIGVAYEYLVFIPSLDTFALLSAPKYSTALHDAFTKSPIGSVITVKPALEVPKGLDVYLYFYEVTVSDTILTGLEDKADYAKENERFADIA